MFTIQLLLVPAVMNIKSALLRIPTADLTRNDGRICHADNASIHFGVKRVVEADHFRIWVPCSGTQQEISAAIIAGAIDSNQTTNAHSLSTILGQSRYTVCFELRN